MTFLEGFQLSPRCLAVLLKGEELLPQLVEGDEPLGGHVLERKEWHLVGVEEEEPEAVELLRQRKQTYVNGIL
jgi:hypothetical protein